MNPFPTTAPRPLQPETESLIKILAILNSAIGPDGLKIYLPDGVAWGTITGALTDQNDLVTYVGDQITSALVGALTVKGAIDASTNPDYPAAVKGDFYFISPSAGKIGGVAGEDVSIGDSVVCIADSASGDQATVGANWVIVNTNIPGLSPIGVLLATLATPGVDSFAKIKADGSVELVDASAMGGGGIDIQDVWASIPSP